MQVTRQDLRIAHSSFAGGGKEDCAGAQYMAGTRTRVRTVSGRDGAASPPLAEIP